MEKTKVVKRVAGAALVAVLCSGCFAVGAPWEEGKFLMVGDPEGIRAFADYQNGLKSQGDSFFQFRQVQELHRTARKLPSEQRGGFIQKLFGLGGGQGGGAVTPVRKVREDEMMK